MPWVLIPLLALTIPIVALLGTLVVKPWIAHRERLAELAGGDARAAARTEQLEARVRVLERIVTDPDGARRRDLAGEIDRLRDPGPALPPPVH